MISRPAASSISSSPGCCPGRCSSGSSPASSTAHSRELVPRSPISAACRATSLEHARLKFHHTRDYNTLQKLTYAGVLFILFPLMILTGLAMSPSMNAASVPRRHVRRPADGAHHPFRRHGAARGLLPRPHPDDPRGRPDQRAAVDHHRLVPHRPAKAGDNPNGAHDHGKFTISRRTFLTAAAVGVGPRHSRVAMSSTISATATSGPQLPRRRQRPDLPRAAAARRPRRARAGILREPTSASRSGRTASPRPTTTSTRAC